MNKTTTVKIYNLSTSFGIILFEVLRIVLNPLIEFIYVSKNLIISIPAL